ncbi:WD repeat-containing protein 16 [Mizuhopecten yessoensis]|uniref:Cilia- and flagella-associated protein 52 n=1 Tax=Mizuhopecten yessoensis TaxID=6573 RepID=A0A210QCL6_MIZYE|nr:WD repeat-containing protein 16 [Mizuhopecten yessoensis]
MAKTYDGPSLDLEYVVGYSGITNGLKVHPDRHHLIYSLGNTVIIENIETKKQQTLMGHSADVSCLTVSNSGKYIASGQVIHMGFTADIIIWDYEQKAIYARLQLHKVKIEALVFSPKDSYLLSLGGQDDGSLVVWDVATKNAICGSKAQSESAGNTLCLAYHETDELKFFSGGDQTLRVWELNVDNRKIKPQDVRMGQHVRMSKCIQMKGNYLLCGTYTGDILGINVDTNRFQFLGPKGGHNSKKAENFQCGVTALAHLPGNQEMLVGSGNGEVALVTYLKHKDNLSNFFAFQFYVGMSNSQIYRFTYTDFACELVKSSHHGPVTDIVFPSRSNELFVTSQLGQIRFWLLKTGQELLRQTVANITCTSVALTEDGSKIYTAWNDGKIRGYGFVKGKGGAALKLMFTIHDAHSNGVTALTCTPDGHCILSGGGEGQVRVWSISHDFCTTSLEHNMMEHKGSVSDIRISKNGKSCVSSSHDGTTIIWDLEKKRRSQIVFANTLFKCVCFNKEENQIMTSGTDRKLVYWDVSSGSQVRELDGSASGSINAMDITADGNVVATGGDDKILKLWDYKRAEIISVGIGHSGNITKIKVSPGNTHIVSVSEDGAILVWKFPQYLV